MSNRLRCRLPYQIASGNVASIDRGRDTAGIIAAGAGAAMTIALNAARVRFSHWPFHPAGYAIANTFIPDLLWFPFFLGWLAKLLTLRFGGMGGYRCAVPLPAGDPRGDGDGRRGAGGGETGLNGAGFSLAEAYREERRMTG